MEIISARRAEYPPAGAAWPKYFYHAEVAPEGQVFENEEAFLASEVVGWSEKPIAHSSPISSKTKK